MAGYTSYDDLVVTTLEKRSKKAADNILDNNVLLMRLKERGHVVKLSGGRVIVEEIHYKGGSNFKRYSGYEALDTTPIQFHTAAEYPWAQASVTVSASGLEMRSNMGETQMIPLLKSRIEAAEKDFQNNISTDVYSDGTASGGKQIEGLDAKVAEAPSTGVVGGIDRASNTWWENNHSGDETISATTVLGLMQTEWLSVVRGADHPTVIVADANLFGFFWDALSEIQRITSPEKGTSGFRSLEFAGPSGFAPVFYDSACQTNRMYFLNENYLFFKVHSKAFFSPLPEVRAVNQDALVVPIVFQGNLTMSNSELQTVLWT